MKDTMARSTSPPRPGGSEDTAADGGRQHRPRGGRLSGPSGERLWPPQLQTASAASPPGTGATLPPSAP